MANLVISYSPSFNGILADAIEYCLTSPLIEDKSDISVYALICEGDTPPKNVDSVITVSRNGKVSEKIPAGIHVLNGGRKEQSFALASAEDGHKINLQRDGVAVLSNGAVEIKEGGYDIDPSNKHSYGVMTYKWTEIFFSGEKSEKILEELH